MPEGYFDKSLLTSALKALEEKAQDCVSLSDLQETLKPLLGSMGSLDDNGAVIQLRQIVQQYKEGKLK